MQQFEMDHPIRYFRCMEQPEDDLRDKPADNILGAFCFLFSDRPKNLLPASFQLQPQ